MSIPVYMLTKESQYPFLGAFDARAARSSCWVNACGFVAHSSGVRGAYLPARRIGAAISRAAHRSLGASNRYVIIESIWQEIANIAPEQLGREKGADLCLLVLVGDEKGTNLAATGISGLWGMTSVGRVWLPMVPQQHPLLRLKGRSETLPGSLRITAPPSKILATSQFLAPRLPEPKELSQKLKNLASKTD